MTHISQIDSTEQKLFVNKRRKPIWVNEVLAAIFMSVSGWLEDFIKAFGHLSSAERETFPSSPVCVSGEAGASHSTKEYLSFQLVRWIKWPSRREARGKDGEREFEGERWGHGESFAETGNVPQTKMGLKERVERCLPSYTWKKNKTIRMT